MSTRRQSSRKPPRKPLHKPLWRWDPFWYIALFVAIFVTSALQAAGASLAFLIFLGISTAIAFAVIVQLIVSSVHGPSNPDAAGNLSTLAGLTLVHSNQSEPSVAAPMAEPTEVFDAKRHQNAIDAAYAFGGDAPSAVLVPGASRWLGRRLRIAVHLAVDRRTFHAGYLPPNFDAEFNELLLPLRDRGQYVHLSAAIRGTKRPLTVMVDLAPARAAANIDNVQQASS